MPNRDVIVIGASAGGIPALVELLQPLPPSLPASVLIVVHTGAESEGVLPTILERGTG